MYSKSHWIRQIINQLGEPRFIRIAHCDVFVFKVRGSLIQSPRQPQGQYRLSQSNKVNGNSVALQDASQCRGLMCRDNKCAILSTRQSSLCALSDRAVMKPEVPALANTTAKRIGCFAGGRVVTAGSCHKTISLERDTCHRRLVGQYKLDKIACTHGTVSRVECAARVLMGDAFLGIQ